MEIRKIKIQKRQVNAELVPSSMDAEKRTVEVVFSTGAPVKRYDWSIGPYTEMLEVSDNAIISQRLNNGSAPVLANHDAYDLNSVLGVVERSWVDGGAAKAVLRFSQDPNSDAVWQKIADGILKSVSVGYRTLKMKDVTPDTSSEKVLMATSWEPLEISIVAIPADPNAQVRASEQENEVDIEQSNQVLKTQEGVRTMTEAEKEQKEKEAAQKREAELTAARMAAAAESAEIMAAVRNAGLESTMAEDFIKRGVKADEVRKEIIKELAKKQEQVRATPTVEIVRDEKETRKEGIVEAILHRGLGDKLKEKGEKLSENGRRFRGMSLMDIARETTGLRDLNISREKVLERAFITGSDLKSIVLDASNKALAMGYDEVPPTFEPFVTRADLRDFKKKHIISMGSFPALKKVGEHGEVSRGKLADNGETYKLDSYAVRVAITRQVIYNDDLAVLTQLPNAAGKRARELEADLVYGLITSNPAMSDTNLLLSSAHKNVYAAATLNAASFDSASALMRKQVGLNKERIDLRPKILLVPVALEGTANKLANADILGTDTNIYKGLFIVCSDPRLDDNSASKYYWTAAKSQAALIELGSLNGEGPIFYQKETTDILGMEVETVYDVGAGLVDFRAIVGNGSF
jgi:HK97 family phage prohead protease